jgi:hypothetical protein
MECKIMTQPSCLISEAADEWEGGKGGVSKGGQGLKLVISGDSVSVPRSRDAPRS